EGGSDGEGHLRRSVPAALRAGRGDREEVASRDDHRLGVEKYFRTITRYFDGDPTNTSCGAGDSDPVLYPYTTFEPHSPVWKSLRATFDALLSGRLPCGPVDQF